MGTYEGIGYAKSYAKDFTYLELNNSPCYQILVRPYPNQLFLQIRNPGP